MKAQNQASKDLQPVTSLLTASWQMYHNNFSMFLGYAAWIILPYLGMLTLLILVPIDQLFGAYLPLYLLFAVLQGIVAIWVSNVILISANSLAGSETIKEEDISRRGWRLVLPVLLVGIIETLAILGGFILLIIPGIIFAIWFSFAQIAVILDGKRGLAALSYSRSLVVGRFFKVLRPLFLGPFTIFLVYIIIITTFVALGFLLTGNFDAVINEEVIPIWPDVVEMIVNIFLLPMFLIFWTLLYRNVKETRV